MVVGGAILKTRLPVSLNDATWMITDSASMTKTSDEHEQEFLLDETRRSERAAKAQRSDVTA